MDQKQQRNGLQEIIDEALEAMACDQGVTVDDMRVNLAELSRRTGLSRSKLRTLQAKGFKVTPHGRYGQRASYTVLSAYTDTIDKLLTQGVTNSSVCMERIVKEGYGGSLSIVKQYIKDHRHLVPSKRKLGVIGQNVLLI